MRASLIAESSWPYPAPVNVTRIDVTAPEISELPFVFFSSRNITKVEGQRSIIYIVHKGNHSEARQTGMIVLPYVAVIIITVILCLSLIIAVYLVVRRKKEVHSMELFYESGSIKL